MKKFLIPAALVAFALTACQGNKTENQNVDSMAQEPAMEEVIVTPEWVGTFEGTLPMADAEGEKVVLTLNEDGSFKKDAEVLSSNPDKAGMTTEDGTWTLDEATQIITLVKPNATEEYYQWANGTLTLLNDKKEAPAADMADKYVLNKK